MTAIAELSYETFVNRIDDTFTLRWPDGGDSFSAVLLECTAAAHTPDSSRTASFSLTFRAGPDAPAEQGCYLLSALDIEASPIFLVPVGRRAEGVDLQAVFNQLDPIGEAESSEENA